jgi:hypothetical protein
MKNLSGFYESTLPKRLPGLNERFLLPIALCTRSNDLCPDLPRFNRWRMDGFCRCGSRKDDQKRTQILSLTPVNAMPARSISGWPAWLPMNYLRSHGDNLSGAASFPSYVKRTQRRDR